MSTAQKRALVTGATRGIGRACALALAAAGYDVAVTGRTLREGEGTIGANQHDAAAGVVAVPGSLESTAAGIEEQGREALAIPMDLGDTDSVRQVAATVLDTWGGVDVLINNAIVQLTGSQARFLDLDPAILAATLAGNVTHQVILTQRLLPPMVAAGGGVIINLTSGSAAFDPPAPADSGGWGYGYSSSKAAFARMAGVINSEYPDAGVRAYNLDPGFVVTESRVARGGAEKITGQGYAADTPELPAAAAVWLASDAGREWPLGKIAVAQRLRDKGLISI